MPAPVGYTCPDIDSIISHMETMDSLVEILEQVCDIDDILRHHGICDNRVNDPVALMEELRSANDALRTWGDESEKRIEELEPLEEEVEDLRSSVQALEQQLDELDG